MKTRLLFLLIVSTRISLASEVPVNEPAVLTGVTGPNNVAIASNGRGFVAVVARDYGSSGGAQRFAIPFGIDGELATPFRIPLPDSLPPPTPRVAMASDGESYVVVTGGGGGTQAFHLDANGRPTTNQWTEVHPTTRTVYIGPARNLGVTERSIAWDGARYVVTSTLETEGPRTQTLIASTLASDASVQTRRITIQENASVGVVAARNGIAAIAFRDDSSLFVRTLGAGDTVSDATFVASVLADTNLAIASGDDGFLLVWTVNNALLARRLSPGGTPHGSIMILGSERNAPPAVTWHQGRYVVAWADKIIELDGANVPHVIGELETGSSPSLASNGRVAVLTYATSVARRRVMDRGGVGPAIDIERWAAPQGLPGGAYANGLYGIAWSESSAIGNRVKFGRVTAQGARLDGNGIDLGAGSAVIAVAAGRESFAVLWRASNAPLEQLKVTRIARDGRALDATPILIADYRFRPATIGADDLGYVVVYVDPVSNTAIEAARLPESGPLGKPVVIAIGNPLQIHIATAARSLLIVYQDVALSGVLVSSDTLSPTPLEDKISGPLPFVGFADSFDVGAVGGEFLVAWRGEAQIAARRVRRDGTLTPPLTVFAPESGVIGTSAIPRVVTDGSSARVQILESSLTNLVRTGSGRVPVLLSVRYVEDLAATRAFVTFAERRARTIR